MGQLEKYGLYVLCLVIFLILGVTIWGDPANANGSGGGRSNVTQQEAAAMRAQLSGAPSLGAPSLGGQSPGGQSPGGQSPGAAQSPGTQSPGTPSPGTPGAGGSIPGGTLQSLLRPGTRPPKAKPSAGGGPKPGGQNGGNQNRGNATLKPENPNKQPVKPAPVVAKNRTYTVRKGDTLGGIAQRELGSVRHVNKIQALNRGLNPNKLSIGKKIQLPPRPGSGASNTSRGSGKLNAHRTYTVSKGDSFAKIARIELGSEKRVSELLQLNDKVNPRRLAPGMKIKLPLK